MKGHKCGNCFYKIRDLCYYNPPSCVFTADYKVISVHPPVSNNDICSKWTSKKK